MKNIADMTHFKERDFIHKLKATLPGDDTTAIGDDCAVYKISSSRWGLFTTDISIEHVHFELTLSSPYSIGLKSMESNLSDIAAMGGRPVYAFISLGIPQYCDEALVDELYRGFVKALTPHNSFIAGGDLSTAQELIINICVYGETTEQAVLRSGAQQNDFIYITGHTGLSRAGLEALQNSNAAAFPQLVKKHREPVSRLDLVPFIMKHNPTAMIDISDSLASELHHICDNSNCGCEIFAHDIPCHDELVRFCDTTGKDIMDYLLLSGEEYELLFTSPQRIVHTDIHCIGNITDSDRLVYKNSTASALPADGYEHSFRRLT